MVGCLGILPSGAKLEKGTLLDLRRSSGVQYAWLPVPFCLRLRQVNRADMQAHCLRRRKSHKTPLPVPRACTTHDGRNNRTRSQRRLGQARHLEKCFACLERAAPLWGLPFTLLFLKSVALVLPDEPAIYVFQLRYEPCTRPLYIRASGSRSLHKTISCCRPPVARSGERRPKPGVYAWRGGDSAG